MLSSVVKAPKAHKTYSILEKTVDKIEELYQSPQDGVTGASTGYADLDNDGGMQPSDLNIVHVHRWVKQPLR